MAQANGVDQMEPEIIEGLGQFRAGLGAIITDWFKTPEEAIREYWRLVIECRKRGHWRQARRNA